MYNQKCCCEGLMKTLKNKKKKSLFVGPYPYEKKYNSVHKDRIRGARIEFATDATLEELQEEFKIIKVNDSYCKSAVIEAEMKQNLLYFTVYYKGDYVSKVDGSVTPIKSLDDILGHRNFLQDTLSINVEGELLNNPQPQEIDAFQDVMDGLLTTTRPIVDTIKKDPLVIFELLYKASNTPFQIQQYQIDAIKENYHYLSYETEANIVEQMNKLINSSNPKLYIEFIRECFVDFELNGKKPFAFISELKQETIDNLEKIDANDSISRYAYILKDCDPKTIKFVNSYYKLNAPMVNWLIDHFELPLENDYKTAIYNAIPSLSVIKDRKACLVFKLHVLMEKLNMIYSVLDPANAEKYNKLLWLVRARPFCTKQIIYDDINILRILKIDFDIENIVYPSWFNDYKEDLVKKILYTERHPNDEKYQELMIELYNEKYRDLVTE